MQIANSWGARSSCSSAENSSAIPGLGLPGPQRVALDRLLLLLVDQLLVQRQALMVKDVTETLALGAEVLLVVGVGDRLDRNLVGDRQVISLQPVDLLRVI